VKNLEAKEEESLQPEFFSQQQEQNEITKKHQQEIVKQNSLLSFKN
jgi:hypothetical protein